MDYTKTSTNSYIKIRICGIDNHLAIAEISMVKWNSNMAGTASSGEDAMPAVGDFHGC